MSLETNIFGFEDFVLDTREKVLFCNEKPIALTPKAYLLLKVLVENHGRVIEKQELMETVWPDSFVEEGNLPYTANLLRKALGDSKDSPRFIETVPRRGYRFIAPVTLIIAGNIDSKDLHETPSNIEPKANTRPRPRRVIGFSIAVAAIILAASGIWLAMRQQSSSSAPILSKQFSVEQLSNSGSSRRAAISPDGKYCVYSEDSNGKESLWMRNIESSENVQIVPPSDDEYFGLTFSNSGQTIYFVRVSGGGHALPSLYRIEASGGVPVKVIDNVGDRRVSLSADDSQIAFARCHYKKDDFCAGFLVNANGENERRLLTTESGTHIRDIRLAPDGRSAAIAMGRYNNDRNDSRIVEVDIETGSQRELFTERFAYIHSLEWLPDGHGLLFSASNFMDGKAAIYFVDRTSGSPQQMTRDAASYQTLSLDRQAERMIAVQEVPDYRIHSVSTTGRSTLSAARDLTTVSSGKIFYSTFDGEIWSVNPNGTEQRQLTNTRPAEREVRVSPDQKTLFFSTDEGGNRQVWRMNADGTDRRQLTRSVGGYPLTVTADGRYVFYESTLDSYLYKVSVDGTEEVVVLDKRVDEPAVSPDGNLMAHFINEGMVRKLAVVDLNSKQNVKVIAAPDGSRLTRRIAWSADSKMLNYITITDGKNILWQQALNDTPPQKTAELEEGEILSITPYESGNFAYVIGKWRYDVMLLRGLE